MEQKISIALAGNPNVGKSVIFNHLTGLHQHVGNWPGKTVERCEGTLYYKGYFIDVVDLPGIYSLTPYSMEEMVSREYIAIRNPDFVINIVDATHLERNLLLTLQLLELQKPMILSLNMINLTEKIGIEINEKELEEILGIPIVPTIAIYGTGISKLLNAGIKLINNIPKASNYKIIKYGKEVEDEIEKIILLLGNINSKYPKRWLAIKVLEKDAAVKEIITKEMPGVLIEAEKSTILLEKIHGHDSSVVVADERCHAVSQIIKKVVRIEVSLRVPLSEKLDRVFCDRIWGYPILAIILALIFGIIFEFGNWFSLFLENIFSGVIPWYENIFGNSLLALIGQSAIDGILAMMFLVLPYVLPFYVILFLLEDWGYLARVAFLLDGLMHKIGVHGKAFIPLMLGYGCSVPACLSCKIMETHKERFLTAFLTTLIPCAARTVIIMGLVGKFVGIFWALGLYVFNLLIVFILGKIAFKILPGESTELIMEMPDFRTPNIKTILIQTWLRIKDFIYIAAPIVIISGMAVQGLYAFGLLDSVADFLSPITVGWFGLPAATGILLIFGILRKELILLMLAALIGTVNFLEILSPVQMITLAIVSVFYVPCVATIVVLWKEFGWKRAIAVSLFEVFFAIGLGGLVFRALTILL